MKTDLEKNIALYRDLCGVRGLDAGRELLNILVTENLFEKVPEIVKVNIDKELWDAIHLWQEVIEKSQCQS